MVILDCLKQSIFLSHHHRQTNDHYGNNRQLTSATLVRSPSPSCHCSCHNQPLDSGSRKSDVNSTLTSNNDHFGADSSHIYSSVSPKVRFKLSMQREISSIASIDESTVTSTKGGPLNSGSYLQTSSRDSNYCDIGDLNGLYAKQLNGDRLTELVTSVTSPTNPFCQLYSTKLKPKPVNILCIVRLNPFKFVTMESIRVNNRLIVFSLVDSFTKLSPNKFFENFIHKLKEEGNRSITVFNLSESLEYLRESLNVPVCEFGWSEKHAPSLEKLCSLCKAIDSWLSFDSDHNVAVIYSKRDLSRASLAVAVFIEYIKICLGDDSTFDVDAMQHFFQHNLLQYLQPSQKRYIKYFIDLLSGQTKINTQQFYLNNIIIRKIPNFEGNGTCKPFIKIYQGMNLIYSSSIVDIDLNYINEYDIIVFPLDPPLKLRGEILVKCCHQRTNPSSRTVMFLLQFHTGAFLNDVAVFTKDDIDIASYDKRFHPDTQIEFLFNEVKFEPLENVRYFEDDQITKWNSYENFFFEDKSLEYTKGPLDGSLYATIPKKPNAQFATNNEDETILDELLNEIFSEIESFPDVPPSPLSKDNNNISETMLNCQVPLISDNASNEKLPQTEPIAEQVTVVESSVNLCDTSIDYSEMTWLQRQQLKLKNKQDKHHPARNVEKRLMEELKHTIKSHKSVTKQLNSTGTSVEESRTPPVPTRTSSRNIGPLFAEQCQLSQPVPILYTENNINQPGVDVIDRPTSAKLRPTNLDGSNNSENGDLSFYSAENGDNRNHLTFRSVTPSFPVLSLRQNNHLYSPTSDNVSKSFPLFIRDTSSFWYKPNISREEAVKLLQDKPSGTFIIRDSNSFHGAYGLAVKVFSATNDSVTPNTDLSHLESVRHFLIESTSKGVQIKGCSEEPVFSSLASLVNQHSITRISLPTTLLIPSSDFEDQNKSTDLIRIYENGAVCNVLYFTCEDVESLTGPNALRKVIDNMFSSRQTNKVKSTVVHFKASNKGITLTDNNHKIFFRQHYPLQSLRFCNIDPEGRVWRDNKTQIESVLYGFVTLKKGSTTDNECLIFGHYEPDQPSHAIVDFVNKLMTL